MNEWLAGSDYRARILADPLWVVVGFEVVCVIMWRMRWRSLYHDALANSSASAY